MSIYFKMTNFNKKKFENHKSKKLWINLKPYIKIDKKWENLMILKLKNTNFIKVKAKFKYFNKWYRY